MKKKKVIWIIIGCIVVASTIAIPISIRHKHNNEKQYQEDLSQRFDEIMEKSFPFLSNFADALYLHSQVLENNARIAYKNFPQDNFVEAFCTLNQQYSNTEEGRNVHSWLYHFRNSFNIGYAGLALESGGGELRKKESKAYNKLLYASDNLKLLQEEDYNTILKRCNESQKWILEAMKDLSKYNNYRYGVDDWRWVNGLKYQPMFDRYKEEKGKLF